LNAWRLPDAPGSTPCEPNGVLRGDRVGDQQEGGLKMRYCEPGSGGALGRVPFRHRHRAVTAIGAGSESSDAPPEPSLSIALPETHCVVGDGQGGGR